MKMINALSFRLQQSSSANDDFEKKRSQAAIRAMAQKELEKERQVTGLLRAYLIFAP